MSIKKTLEIRKVKSWNIKEHHEVYIDKRYVDWFGITGKKENGAYDWGCGGTHIWRLLGYPTTKKGFMNRFKERKNLFDEKAIYYTE